MAYSREEVIALLKASLAAGKPILGAGAGVGISAKFTEKGGADLIIIYNSGRYRMGGLSSLCGLLPIGDANGIVLEMGEREVLPIVKKAPVIAGIFASDPTRTLDYLLKRVKDMGFSGVINFPTVGLIEGAFRDNLEHTGIGFARDVELTRLAHKMDLFTMAYVFTPEQAKDEAEAGVDCIVCHMGDTVGGSVGQTSGVPSLDRAVQRTREMKDIARKVNPDVFVLCHGGPIALPADAAYVIQHAEVQGFVGASSVERLPVEKPLTDASAAFKSIKLK